MGYYAVGRVPFAIGLEIIHMPRKSIPLDLDYLRRAYLSGRDAMALAQEFEVSDSTVRRRLRQADIKIRSHSDAAIILHQQRSPESRKVTVLKQSEAGRRRW